MLPKPQKDILSDFDEKFYEGERNSVFCKKHEVFATPFEIKSYIRSKIQEVLERVKEGINKCKEEENNQGSYKYDECYDECIEVVDKMI